MDKAMDDELVPPGSHTQPMVTICIPHYQLMGLMKFCLGAIRRYTRGLTYEVIVVDNGSKDESLEWLRSLSWITLIDRGKETPDNWIHAMNTALDMGLARARGQYYLIQHSDTIVKRADWLARMVEVLESGPLVASVGSGKLELKGRYREMLKDATDTKRFRLWLRRTILQDTRACQLYREPCARDYCALYKTKLLRENNLSFVGKGGYSAGETMYYDLKALGYHASLIPVREMMDLMDHIAHATGALLKERALNHSRSIRKTRRRLARLYKRYDYESLMASDALSG